MGKTTNIDNTEKRELYNKELGDAQRRAKTYGLPFMIFRGKVHYFDGKQHGRPMETASEAEQMLWDALA